MGAMNVHEIHAAVRSIIEQIDALHDALEAQRADGVENDGLINALAAARDALL